MERESARKQNGPSGLAELLTADALHDEAGARAFERGLHYYQTGAVKALRETANGVTARVAGTQEFSVRLAAAGGELAGDCTCPVGDRGEFCKHAVATGLAWLAREIADKPRARRGKANSERDVIRRWLEQAPHATLMKLLMEEVENEPALRHRLYVHAARHEAAHHVDVAALKKTISSRLRVRDFLDHTSTRRLAERAESVLELISGLREDGHADAAWTLVQHALERALAAYSKTDDSGGWYGDVLRSIAEEHLQACKAAKPDATDLGAYLFRIIYQDDWGLIHFDAYAPILGDAGIAVIRQAAEQEWATVPARGSGDHASFVEYFRITQIMEALARHAGDTDMLIEIHKRNLTSAFRFLTVAELCSAAGRDREALEWAERGHAAFARHDRRLVAFLVDAYQKCGRHDDAIRVAWDAFQQHPDLEGYQRLKHASDSIKTWPTWRTSAMGWLRNTYLPKLGDYRERFSPGAQRHSLLVEILLWEGDSDAAFTEARAGGCATHLWFDIAKAHEANHPGRAADIYCAQLEGIVRRAKNDAYDEGTALLLKIRTLRQQAGDNTAFQLYLADVRTQHKAKRNFMKRLDDAGLRAS